MMGWLVREIERRRATLDETCTHDGTVIEERGMVHLVQSPPSKHVPCHQMTTRFRSTDGSQRRFAPSR
jgi:hypothetical protein